MIKYTTIYVIHLENSESLESQYHHTTSSLIYKIHSNYIAFPFKPYWLLVFRLFFLSEIEVSYWNRNKDMRLIHILNEQENYYDCIDIIIRMLPFISSKLFSFLSNRLKPFIYFKCVGIDTQWAEDSFDIHWLIYIFIFQLSKLTVEPNLHFLINSFFIW